VEASLEKVATIFCVAVLNLSLNCRLQSFPCHFSSVEMMIHYQQLGNEGLTVYAYGDAAVATGGYREKGELKGKNVVRHGGFTDTWIRQNAAWKWETHLLRKVHAMKQGLKARIGTKVV
jgi:Domain of unknown function (DUF4440)